MLNQQNLGISRRVGGEVLYAGGDYLRRHHQMPDSSSSRLQCLLILVGAAWIWLFLGFWLLEGKAVLLEHVSPAVAGVLGFLKEAFIKSFGFLSAFWWGLAFLWRTERGLLAGIRLIISRVILGSGEVVNKGASFYCLLWTNLQNSSGHLLQGLHSSGD